jgi:hypothetical protein
MGDRLSTANTASVSYGDRRDPKFPESVGMSADAARMSACATRNNKIA